MAQTAQIIDAEIELLKQKCTHPLSQTLKPNPNMDNYKPYHLVLPEYNSSHNDPNPNNPSRFDFSNYRPPNIGWKFHLNVASENIVEVSRFLLSQGYWHKYFSGGELEDGKVFTIYIGSRKKAEQECIRLSTSLESRLARPVYQNEIEFARGVIGRFSVTSHDFTRYGILGIHLWNSAYGDDFLKLMKMTGKERVEIAKKSHIKLKELYGEYYTG